MRTFALCASLGLAVSAVCQDAAVGQLHPKQAFRDFQAAAGGVWTAQWHAATGTPSAIYGTGLPIQDWRGNNLEEARRHALAALQQHKDLLGLGTSEFREVIGARMGRSWSFTFDQFFRGLPVIEGRADVRINMKGVVAMLGSRAWPIPADFDTTPKIGEELATALAWRALGQSPNGVPQPAQPPAPRLVIWGDHAAADSAPFFLCWEVSLSNVDRDGQGVVGRYYVDAITGEIRHFASDKHECGSLFCRNTHHGANRTETNGPDAPLPLPVPTVVTVQGWTRTGIDAYSPLVNVPLRGIVLNVPGVGTRTTGQNGQFTIDIAAPVNITVGALDGTHHNAINGANAPSVVTTVTPGVNATIQLLTAAATTNEAAHTTTAYFVDFVNEWTRAILGTGSPTVNTAMNTISGMTATVNIASTCNAYYTGNTINFYNAGGGCANTAFSTVVAHEWGHGLDDRFGGISNTTGDGLSEGWGDIIGMYLMDTPLLGSGFQSAGVALRRGDNTRLYPQTGQGVHTAGQVWMGFAWRLRERLRASLGTTQAVQISNDIVMSSIVADAVNQPDAVLQVFIADDDDGNLANGTPHYAQLSGAATDKNLPFPALQVAAVTHTPLANTGDRLVPRMVNVTAAPVSSGTINAVRLVYNAGAGNVTRVMQPNGQPNGYRALLPGINGGSVAYWIEADHSSNATVRLPASGSFSYVVDVATSGTFNQFFLQNFDAGAAGWTSAQVLTQNDWQVGDPAGRTGTSSGVAWADPQTTPSGTFCYGNDLGNTIGTQAWNGAYAANVENYLRSPIINCSGRTGVTVRFKRWLTVEEALYDQATLFCNGIQVWQNPQVGNLVDTSWQTVEYRLPMADNNASVQLEWRLKSDAGLQLGGWNIDDVELGTRIVVPLQAEYTMLPEQAVQGSNVTLAVATQGAPRPFLVAIGDTAGPTAIPGIPVVLVGGAYFTLPGFTDATGNFAVTFAAPSVAAATGLLWYSQVLTLDATNTQIVTSNAFLNLFTL